MKSCWCRRRRCNGHPSLFSLSVCVSPCVFFMFPVCNDGLSFVYFSLLFVTFTLSFPSVQKPSRDCKIFPCLCIVSLSFSSVLSPVFSSFSLNFSSVFPPVLCSIHPRLLKKISPLFIGQEGMEHGMGVLSRKGILSVEEGKGAWLQHGEACSGDGLFFFFFFF